MAVGPTVLQPQELQGVPLKEITAGSSELQNNRAGTGLVCNYAWF